MSTFKIVTLGLIALTVLRLILGATTEVSSDEAYYYLWSQHLAPSYYSKGPGIALTIKLGTTLFGATALGVRFFAPLLALGTSLLVYRLGRGLFNEQVAAWCVVLLNLTPIFNAGAVIMTIDPLSVFFWVAAMLTFWLALHRAKSLHFYWPLTGFLIGLGFLAKYTNALLLLSILLLLTLLRRWRGQLRRPGLYVMLFCFALCTLPVLIWNAQHDWITVMHLKERGSLDESVGVHPLNFLEYVGMHLGVYSPLVFAGMVWALWRAARRFPVDDSETFLLFFSLPIVLLYFGLSFREAGEANWTAPGFLSAGLLLVHYWQEVEIGDRLKRNLRSATLALAGLMSCVALNTEIVRQAGIPWPYRLDPATRLRGWKESSAYLEAVATAAADSLGEEVFVIANKYQTAAGLAFYLSQDAPVLRPAPGFPRIHIIESQNIQNQFSFWPRYDGRRAVSDKDGDAGTSPFLGRHALYVTDDADRINPPPAIMHAFRNTEITGVVDIVRFGQPIRRLKVFTCYDYQSLPL